ncbi:MAG: GTPase HflX [Labilithrix sp.]|nr:GTPase HflX [Labilithrix sp.]MCW5813967.1 GTPase HflX [Labilithrix sp.]
MSRPKSSGEAHASSIRRAVIVAAHTHQRSLTELASLLAGLGVEVLTTFVQARDRSSSYLGAGKLREVAAVTGGPGVLLRGPDAPPPPADGDLAVVADDELTPAEHRNLSAALGAPVLDRTEVILQVFETRARTIEAKLAIELAWLEHRLPRVRDDRSLGDREGGGGRAARGNSNVELAKQRLRDRIAAVRAELGAIAARERPRRDGAFRVTLVGYTNAGKSSLMRALTGADVLVEDKLFATLGTTVRALAPPAAPPVVVADTVGFLHRLPHALLASFRSTLAEAREADLLLLVADASDPEVRAQLATTSRTLEDVGAGAIPSLVLLNKIDRVDAEAREALTTALPAALPLSAFRPEDVAALRSRVAALAKAGHRTATFEVPYDRLGAVAPLREHLDVVEERFGEHVTMTVRAREPVLATLAARIRAPD